MEGRHEHRSARRGVRLIVTAADPAARGATVGRAFGRAFAAIRHNPAAILILALLFGGLPSLGLDYALVELDRISGPDPDLAAIAGQLAIVFMLWTLAGSLLQGVLTRAVVADSRGKRAGIGECLLAAARVAPALIGLGLVVTVAVAAGIGLLVVPGIILSVIWSVAIPALVEERSGIRVALHRSTVLAKGAGASIFGLLLVLLTASIATSLGVEVVSGQLQNPDLAIALRDPTYLTLTIVSETLLSALSATTIVSLYVELKQWKEGDSAESLEQVFA